MDYELFFSKLQSRYHLEEFLLYLHHHPEEFEGFFELTFSLEDKRAWRMLWALEKVSQREPERFTRPMIERIEQMVLTTKHQGMHRIGLSILNSFPAPEPLNVDMLNALYDWMINPKFSIGVQSIAMKLLYKYVLTDNDLLREFIMIIEEADESEFTAAFISSRRNILKKHR